MKKKMYIVIFLTTAVFAGMLANIIQQKKEIKKVQAQLEISVNNEEGLEKRIKESEKTIKELKLEIQAWHLKKMYRLEEKK